MLRPVAIVRESEDYRNNDEVTRGFREFRGFLEVSEGRIDPKEVKD